MGYNVFFSKHAIATLDTLPKNIAQRIVKKVEFYATIDNPLLFARSLQGSDGDYRFRVGDYRVIFSVQQGTIFVSAIGHRREVYLKISKSRSYVYCQR